MKIHLAQFFRYTKKACFSSMPKEEIDKWLCDNVGQAIKELGNFLPICNRVYTHQFVDLDACACTALSNEYALIPGNAKELSAEAKERTSMVLDHPLNPGGKGKASAFSHAYEANTQIQEWICQEINEADTAIKAEGHFTVDEICGSNLELKKMYKRGVAQAQEESKLYPKMEKTCTFHKCGKHLFVELGQKDTSQAADFAIYLQKKYPTLVGAVYKDGNNLGIFRYPGKNEPSFENAAKELPDWYFDSRGGWMLSWGTRKVPKESLPPISQP